MTRDRRVAAIAARQHGVVARRQLLAAGPGAVLSHREAEDARVLDVVAIEEVLRRTRTGSGHAALREVLAEHRRLGTQLTRSQLDEFERRPAETAAQIAALLAGA